MSRMRAEWLLPYRMGDENSAIFPWGDDKRQPLCLVEIEDLVPKPERDPARLIGRIPVAVDINARPIQKPKPDAAPVRPERRRPTRPAQPPEKLRYARPAVAHAKYDGDGPEINLLWLYSLRSDCFFSNAVRALSLRDVMTWASAGWDGTWLT